MATAIPAFRNFCSKAPPSGHFVFTGCHSKILLPATPPEFERVFRSIFYKIYTFINEIAKLIHSRPKSNKSQWRSLTTVVTVIKHWRLWIEMRQPLSNLSRSVCWTLKKWSRTSGHFCLPRLIITKFSFVCFFSSFVEVNAGRLSHWYSRKDQEGGTDEISVPR